MKRIKSACLFLTVTFESADEYEHYKKMLGRKCTKYAVDGEETGSDGLLTVKLRRAV